MHAQPRIGLEDPVAYEFSCQRNRYPKKARVARRWQKLTKDAMWVDYVCRPVLWTIEVGVLKGNWKIKLKAHAEGRWWVLFGDVMAVLGCSCSVMAASTKDLTWYAPRAGHRDRHPPWHIPSLYLCIPSTTFSFPFTPPAPGNRLYFSPYILVHSASPSLSTTLIALSLVPFQVHITVKSPTILTIRLARGIPAGFIAPNSNRQIFKSFGPPISNFSFFLSQFCGC